MKTNMYNTTFQPAFAGQMNAGFTFHEKGKTMNSTLLTADSLKEISKITNKIKKVLKI